LPASVFTDGQTARGTLCAEDETTTATLPPPPASREELAYYVRHHLNQTERLIIMLRYAEELGFDEIAGVLKMAKDDIEEIHRLVVDRLQVSLTSDDALATA
jgi:DNA-directed RNA polymerase specialized sigma subunit